MAAAPAEEEPPEEEVWTTDAGVRPGGTTQLDGSPDDELPLPALPAPSREESAAEGVAVFLRGLPARYFCALQGRIFSGRRGRKKGIRKMPTGR